VDKPRLLTLHLPKETLRNLAMLMAEKNIKCVQALIEALNFNEIPAKQSIHCRQSY